MLVKDKETGTVFDDWVEVEEEYKDSGHDTWTQVCDTCAKKHHLPSSRLSIGEGHGICGVKGCDKESDHYYDFTKEGNMADRSKAQEIAWNEYQRRIQKKSATKKSPKPSSRLQGMQ